MFYCKVNIFNHLKYSPLKSAERFSKIIFWDLLWPKRREQSAVPHQLSMCPLLFLNHIILLVLLLSIISISYLTHLYQGTTSAFRKSEIFYR